MTSALRRWPDRATHTEPAWPVTDPDAPRRPPAQAEDSADLTQIIYASHLRPYLPEVGELP